MSAHTPGPWTATRSDPAEGADVWWITACPAPNQEKEVATVQGGYPHDRHEANARLIAAAPDLLAAAKEVLAALDMWVSEAIATDVDKSIPVVVGACDLEAAVAKADGRS